MSSIDYWYSQQAANEGNIQWQLQETYTELQGLRWHYVLGVDVDEETAVTADMLRIDTTTQHSYVAYYTNGATVHYDTARLLNSSSPLIFPVTTLPAFSLYYVAPVLADALVLYGERDKWVRVSGERVQWLSWQTYPFVLTAQLMGEAGERVVMEWANVSQPTVVFAAECAMDATGQATLTVQPSGEWTCTGQPKSAGQGSQSVSNSVAME